MECDFYLYMKILKSQKIYYLKSHCKHFKIIIKRIFCDFFISSWFEIGNGKKILSVSSKYSYFKPIFNYTKKDFEKGFNYVEIVVCFRQLGCINLIVMFWFTIFACYKNHQHQCFHGEHCCFHGSRIGVFRVVALVFSW